MKVIAFLGSPRENGNTELLLGEAIRGVEESGLKVGVFHLNKMNIKPCQNCGGCDVTGVCIYEDDMTRIYEAIRNADRIILASPIFFFALSHEKVMIDRCQAFGARNISLKIIRRAVWKERSAIARQRNEKSWINAPKRLQRLFRDNQCSRHETLAYIGIDAKGEIIEHPTALRKPPGWRGTDNGLII
jgi:multimeric flavodoxin WrbA